MNIPHWRKQVSKQVGWFILLGAIVGWSEHAFAQLRPIADETLGSERSIVTPRDTDPSIDDIRGGARRGDNLFHSFREFNVEQGRGAYFIDPGVANIISRVTGGVRSEILGTLGVSGGNANLFLINPSGIIFGPNALLDVGGSFVATTADAIQFGEQGFFSASEPTAPPLLTVRPSAFLFNQINSASIVNNSVAPVGLISSGDEALGLRVADGQSLLLLGGNVSMNGSGLNAFGGRVDIAGVVGIGTVGFNQDGSLSFPNSLARANVLLTDGSVVDVLGGGSIAVIAHNLSIDGESRLQAGVTSSSSPIAPRAGDIEIDATGTVTLSGAVSAEQRSTIANSVQSGADAQGGDIRVTAGSLFIEDGAAITANTDGVGDAGDVTVNAAEVRVSGTSASANRSRLITETTSSGNAGNLTITARNVTIEEGGLVATDTDIGSSGDAGDLTITASGDLYVRGASPIGVSPEEGITRFGDHLSRLTSRTRGSGDAGDLTITATNLVIEDGAQVSASNSNSNSTGNGGNLMVNADEVQVSGVSFIEELIDNESFRSRLTTRTVGPGNAGNLTVNARTVAIEDGAEVSASSAIDGRGNSGSVTINALGDVSIGGVSEVGDLSRLITRTIGSGNAGDLTITASNITIEDGAEVSASSDSRSTGTPGNVTITALGDIRISGTSPDENTVSRLETRTGGSRDAGNLSINTRRLLIEGGGQVSADTLENSTGQGGDVRITAGQMILRHSAQATVSSNGSGNAGDLEVSARNLSLRDQAVLSADTESSRGGNVRLQIANSLNLADHSEISATTQDGQGGNLTLNADHSPTNLVRLFDNSRLSAQADGNGNAGSINLNTRSLTIQDGSEISASTVSGQQGGNITLRGLDTLQVNNSEISASTQTGRAGNLQVDANSVQLRGRGGLVVESTQGGTAGNLTIDTDRLTVRDRARVSVSSTGLGRAGDLNVTTRDIFLDDRARLLADTESGRGANINLSVSDTLRLLNNSRIFATTDNEQGGQFTLNVDRSPTRLVELDSSRISTEATGTGDAGNLTLNMRQLNLQDGSEISASTRSGMGGGIILRGINSLQVSNSNVSASTQTGRAGSLRINAESIELNDQGQLAVSATGQDGEAGDLSLRTGQLTLNDAGITVNSAAGRAGNLNITADTIQLNQGNLTAETAITSGDTGANINLQSIDLLLMQNGSQISTNASEDASGGNVNIDASDGFIVAIPNQNNDITASAPVGQGGNIQITTQGIFGLEERPAIPGNGTNDIAATGGSPELSGTVELNTPDVDPTQGLTELPTDVVDASNQITQTCPTPGSRTATSTLNEFIITGRGGLPPSPIDPLTGEESLADWVAIDQEEEIAGTPPDAVNSPPDIANSFTTAAPIVEAQGWVVDEQGEVMLVAEVPATNLPSPDAAIHCP